MSDAWAGILVLPLIVVLFFCVGDGHFVAALLCAGVLGYWMKEAM